MTSSGGPTLGELVRTLERMESELNRRLSEVAQALDNMVTRDLHEAHRTAILDDITEIRDQLKSERERRAADRRMVVGSILTAALSLLVGIVSAAITIALRLNP